MASIKESWILEEHFSRPDDASSSKHGETSLFEFWPMWLMYAPVALQWIGLTLKYRSFTLPFVANPKLTLSGMVGMPKSELLAQATGTLNDRILPWIVYAKTEASPEGQVSQMLELAEESGIHLPFVCKPDIGCRGVGVKRVESKQQLEAILKSYPVGAGLLIQRLASHEPEAGVFFVKDPDTGSVSIPSMTFKFTPSIVGDGRHTFGQLVEKDPRAGRLIHLYKARHEDRWNEVLRFNETVKLVFSASHSKGAIFKDARDFVTPTLVQELGHLMEGLPEFYYGRLDVKFPDIASLQCGEGLEIVEINGASSESIHIWDKDAQLKDAVKQLLWQYRTLFRIGASHRKRGIRPPGMRKFLQRLGAERRLTRSYPVTD
ncbi:MAG: D-alanine--D-alanine ligase [Verrucomicrobiota bacterium]